VTKQRVSTWIEKMEDGLRAQVEALEAAAADEPDPVARQALEKAAAETRAVARRMAERAAKASEIAEVD
jgi:hypothetical protein